MRVELNVRRPLWLSEPSAAVRKGVECCHHCKNSHTNKVQGCQSIATTDMEQESAHNCSDKCSRHYFCICSHLFIRLESCRAFKREQKRVDYHFAEREHLRHNSTVKVLPMIQTIVEQMRAEIGLIVVFASENRWVNTYLFGKKT